ncbi:MAG: trigger factor [Pseudomonadota bacterium]
MKVNVEELSSVQRRLTVEVPAAEVDKLLDGLFRRLNRQAKIKGFRPGKVPRAILEKYYGPQILAEAAESLIGENYTQALEETKLDPVAKPDFDFDLPAAGQDYNFTVTLDVRPEFELDAGLYKGLKLKEPELAVTDEELGKRLEALAERQAMLAPLEEPRPAQTGDVVIIDYQSFKAGQAVEGGAADNVEVELGKGNVPEEIEVALLRAEPAQEIKTTVHYGDEAGNPALKDADVEFVIQVKDVKRKLMPELDDDFARSISPEFETLDLLKDRIRKDLEEMYQGQRDLAVRNQIMDQIRDLGGFDVPASLVQAEAEEMVNDFKTRLRRQGMDPDQVGLDGDKLLEDFRGQAEKKVRAGIVLGRIADQEQVDVAAEDVDQEIQKMSERMGQPAQIIKEMYIKNNMMPTLHARLLEEKTLQAIRANAIIETVDPAQLANETADSNPAS